MSVEIKQHEPGKDLKDFIQVAFEVFEDDPAWVPPLHMEIADRLSISSETVRRHTANIYQKLDVHDRRQAVERALSLRILPDG